MSVACGPAWRLLAVCDCDRLGLHLRSPAACTLMYSIVPSLVCYWVVFHVIECPGWLYRVTSVQLQNENIHRPRLTSSAPLAASHLSRHINMCHGWLTTKSLRRPLLFAGKVQWNLLACMPMFSTALITLKTIKSLHEKVKYYTGPEAQLCAVFIWHVIITPASTNWWNFAIMVIKLNSAPCHAMTYLSCGTGREKNILNSGVRLHRLFFFLFDELNTSFQMYMMCVCTLRRHRYLFKVLPCP